MKFFNLRNSFFISLENSLSFLLIVAALLNSGLCTIDVVCKRTSTETKKTVCEIDEFPVCTPKKETYNFRVNYARPDEIKELWFVPYEKDHAIEVTYIPKEIFTKFSNLVSLHMSTNLTELNTDDFTQAMNLTKLDLQDNKMRIIKTNVFTKMPQNVNETAKTSDDNVIPLHKLRELNLASNHISEIEANSFNGLRNLEVLFLTGNQLTVIRKGTFVGMPKLTFLVLGTNRIHTIEDGALDLSVLSELNLVNNKLKRLFPSIFDRVPKLERIDLDMNEMEHIGQSIYRLTNARYISLMWNQIEDIDLTAFAQIPKLRRLLLANSGFTFATTKIDDEKHWNNSVDVLDIGMNNLADATELNKLRIFPKLEDLNIGLNSFRDLEVGGNRTLKDILPSLKSVHIRGNKMSDEYCSAIEKRLNAQNVFVVK